jgi:hypothetical protein
VDKIGRVLAELHSEGQRPAQVEASVAADRNDIDPGRSKARTVGLLVFAETVDSREDSPGAQADGELVELPFRTSIAEVPDDEGDAKGLPHGLELRGFDGPEGRETS